MISKASYEELFNDRRLERRAERLLSSLLRTGSSSIQSVCETRAEQKAYYRLLRNEKVQEEFLIEEMVQRNAVSCRNKVVLAIQDTTEINLGRHNNRIKHDQSIGPINDSFNGIGFKIHPSLVVNAYTYYPYGYSAVHLWAREEGKEKRSRYEHRQLTVDQKETNTWLQSNERTYQTLSKAKSVIIIQDREGDFYEQFATVAEDGKFYLLVRSNHNRMLAEGIRLWDYIDQQPVAGSYTTTIGTQQRGKPRKERDAQIEIKIGKVSLKKPQKKDVDLPTSSAVLTVIEAREVGCEEEEGVLWRLYTTWTVSSFEDACQVVEWYRCRWFIEEVFKVLKKECFDIEASELESGWAIRKLALMMLDTIIKLFQIAISYDTSEGEIPDTETMFDQKEIECLEKINQQMQGKTQKLSNPFDKTKLSWAFWILARLGGWKGYASQRKPGSATLIKGLKKFYILYSGFTIQKDVGTQ
jgi:hypothetical protein